MGKIKKITENELVGGTKNTDVYPVTSVKAVYDESNERLDNILNRRGVVNISTNYNADHIVEVLTLEQAIAKVPSKDRVLGFQGKFLSKDGWKSYVFIGDSIADWTNKTKWNNYLTGTDVVQESGEAEDKVMSQKAVSAKLSDLSSKADIIEIKPTYYKKYINTNSKIGENISESISSPIEDNNSQSYVINVKEYNIFYIQCDINASPVYCFVDENGVIKESSSVFSSVHTFIESPCNGKLIVNSNLQGRVYSVNRSYSNLISKTNSSIEFTLHKSLLNNDGEIVTSSDFYNSCSDFVEVKENTKILISSSVFKGYFVYAFYNADKIFISGDYGKKINESNYRYFWDEVSVPDNAKYVRVACNTLVGNEINCGYFAKYYSPNNRKDIDAINTTLSLSNNLFDSFNFVKKEMYYVFDFLEYIRIDFEYKDDMYYDEFYDKDGNFILDYRIKVLYPNFDENNNVKSYTLEIVNYKNNKERVYRGTTTEKHIDVPVGNFSLHVRFKDFERDTAKSYHSSDLTNYNSLKLVVKYPEGYHGYKAPVYFDNSLNNFSERVYMQEEFPTSRKDLEPFLRTDTVVTNPMSSWRGRASIDDGSTFFENLNIRVFEECPNKSINLYPSYKWNQVEKNNGEFDFTPFKHYALNAVKRGSRMTVAMFPCSNAGGQSSYLVDGHYTNIPLYMYNYLKDNEPSALLENDNGTLGKSWILNPASDYVFDRTKNIIEAFNRYISETTIDYNGKSFTIKQCIGCFEFRFFGEYGEGSVPSSIFADEDDSKYTRYFESFYNLGTDEHVFQFPFMGEYLYRFKEYIENKYINRKIGFFVDTFGSNSKGWIYTNINKQFIGDICESRFIRDKVVNQHYISGEIGQSNSSIPPTSLFYEVRNLRATSLNLNISDNVVKSPYTNVLLAKVGSMMGYRIILASPSVSYNDGKLSYSFKLTNIGVCKVQPKYYKVKLLIKDLDEGSKYSSDYNENVIPNVLHKFDVGFDITTLNACDKYEPLFYYLGNATTINGEQEVNLQSGKTYYIFLLIEDETGCSAPLVLSVYGRRKDGSYPIGVIEL